MNIVDGVEDVVVILKFQIDISMEICKIALKIIQRSDVSFLRGFVIQPQKLKDFPFFSADRDWLVPEIVVGMFSSGYGSVVVELDANFGSIQSHRSVEHIAAGEVQQCIGILINVVVFDIDSVMYGLLVLADTHVGKTGFVSRR